ncbi:MAG: hypothetical protein Q7T76_03975 [Ferruginibacter sp.]|nr:hypothetical protein [Ferruginibacter sp.]
MKKRFTIQSILFTSFWIIVAAGMVVMLVAAIQKKDAQHCSGLNITIRGVSNHFFVDKKDIQQTIRLISGGNPVGKSIGSFNLQSIEEALQKNIWVRSAQLFFDNNEVLQVNVLEREPMARVFTTGGTTFYLDSSVAMMPLSDKFSARLPVFTNFPSDKKVLLKADSNLLRGILDVSIALQADSFLMAMIEQVDITEQRTFEMVPKIGNTTIIFGDAKEVTEKFNKLQVFYKEVIVKAGWNKYSVIDVQYKNQVVASRKGVKEVAADSIRTLQLMKIIAENAERMSVDTLQVISHDNEQNTTNSNLIHQSIERDDNNSSSNTIEESLPQGTAPAEKPVTQPAAPFVTLAKPVKAEPKASIVPKKPVQKTVELKKPKAVMQKPAVQKPAAKKATNEY